MEKLKKKSDNRGITLVVLVITIVVLLILAGVSITKLSGESGITSQAQKVADESKENVEKNLADLKELEGKLDRWREVKNEKGQVVGVEKAKQKLKIGDYIAYDCTSGEGANASYTSYSYNNRDKNNGITSGYSDDQTFKSNEYTGKWRVLGVSDNGELLIMATENAERDIDGGKYGFYLGDGDSVENSRLAYQYAVDELNNISAIYGKGNGATGARSITVEDINKITGYNPERTGDNEPYNKDKINEYGNEVKLKWNGGVAPEYTSTNGLNGTLTEDHSENGFYYYDEIKKEWINYSYTTTEKEITTIKNTRYAYYPETLTLTKDITCTTGIEHNSEAYKMIFGVDSILRKYWVGTSYVSINSSNAIYEIQRVLSGRVVPTVISYSYGDLSNGCYGVCPVVSISTNTKLVSNGENAGTEENPYTLSE